MDIFDSGEAALRTWRKLPPPDRDSLLRTLVKSVILEPVAEPETAFDPETLRIEWAEEHVTEGGTG